MFIARTTRAALLASIAALGCTAQSEERDSTRAAQGLSCHDPHTVGDAMYSTCSTCASNVCAADPYCCTTAWDSICVGEVSTYCPPPPCAHSICETGKALENGCSSCVSTVCAADPSCCSNAWTSTCEQEARTMCNATCPGPCTTQAQCNPYGSKCCATSTTPPTGYCELPGVGCANGDFGP